MNLSFGQIRTSQNARGNSGPNISYQSLNLLCYNDIIAIDDLSYYNLLQQLFFIKKLLIAAYIVSKIPYFRK